MNQTAVIFGAGKTGRGFAAQLAFLAGCRIVLVDKNQSLVESLGTAGRYKIQVYGAPELSSDIGISGMYHIDDDQWHKEFIGCTVAFTAVFGDNLPELAIRIASALDKRYNEGPAKLLTIFTCENITDAATVLKQKVMENLDRDKTSWLEEMVAFSECIVFRTCLNVMNNPDSLTIMAQNYFRLPCNGDVLKEIPTVYGLEPLRNFKDQLKRKIYTYNCINAVIAYLGAIKGYEQLSDAGNDAGVLEIARRAADETSRAQLLEFGFDAAEQDNWTKSAFEKFSDRNIPDPISRNAADPVRKLRRNDRLVGPALLAIKHKINPTGLIEGILACVQYPDHKTGIAVSDLILRDGADSVLENICGLRKDEKLFDIASAKI